MSGWSSSIPAGIDVTLLPCEGVISYDDAPTEEGNVALQ